MSRPAPALRVVQSIGAHASALRVGDVVRTGVNRYPHYKVIAISGERAWVRDVQFGNDHVVPVETVHRI